MGFVSWTEAGDRSQIQIHRNDIFSYEENRPVFIADQSVKSLYQVLLILRITAFVILTSLKTLTSSVNDGKLQISLDYNLLQHQRLKLTHISLRLKFFVKLN